MNSKNVKILHRPVRIRGLVPILGCHLQPPGWRQCTCLHGAYRAEMMRALARGGQEEPWESRYPQRLEIAGIGTDGFIWRAKAGQDR